MKPVNEIFCKPLEESTGTQFTVHQITTRFTTVARNERRHSMSGFCESILREKGTKCLNYLSTEEMKLISEMTTRFEGVYPEFAREPTPRAPLLDRAEALSNIQQWVQEKLQESNSEKNGKEDAKKRKEYGEIQTEERVSQSKSMFFKSARDS